MQLVEKSSRNTHPRVLDAGEMQIFPGLDLLQTEDSHSIGWQINSWEVRNASSTSGWAGTAPAWICAAGAYLPAGRFAVAKAFPVGEVSAGRIFFIFFFKTEKEKDKKAKSSTHFSFLVCGWSRAFPRASAVSHWGRQMEKVSPRAELASSRVSGASSWALCVKWAPLVHVVLFNWFWSVDPCKGNAAGQMLCWVWGSWLGELLFTGTHGINGLNKFSSGLESSFANFLVG